MTLVIGSRPAVRLLHWFDRIVAFPTRRHRNGVAGVCTAGSRVEWRRAVYRRGGRTGRRRGRGRGRGRGSGRGSACIVVCTQYAAARRSNCFSPHGCQGRRPRPGVHLASTDVYLLPDPASTSSLPGCASHAAPAIHFVIPLMNLVRPPPPRSSSRLVSVQAHSRYPRYIHRNRPAIRNIVVSSRWWKRVGGP